MTVLRDWVGRWRSADDVAPPRSVRARRVLPVVVASASIVALSYVALAPRVSPDFRADDGWAVVDYYTLLIAFIAGVIGCRRTIFVQPAALLLPVTSSSLAAAGVAVATVAMSADVGQRWLVASTAILLVSMPTGVRAWAMLVTALDRAAARRRLSRGARAARAGDRRWLLARVAAIESDDVVLQSRARGRLRLSSSLLPYETLESPPAGAWVLIEEPVVRHGRITRMARLDRLRRARDGWRAAAAVGGATAMVLAWHGAAILAARGAVWLLTDALGIST
jgi:hypothetical protein